MMHHFSKICLCCGAGTALLLLAACTPAPKEPAKEQPPLMAGEARFAPMSKQEQHALQQTLAPFLQDNTAVELWFLAPTRRDNGSFAWCISPSTNQASWVKVGDVATGDLQTLAKQQTTVEHGDTLDYWQQMELRSGQHRLPVAICPAKEFGVHVRGCEPVYAREFHRLLWQMMDKQFDIQKRFDKVVQQ